MPVDHTLVGLFFGLFRNSRNFLLAWRDSIRKVETLEKEQAEYQLQALKNQVNPHFLFNNLNTLVSLIHQNPNTAEKFGNQLAMVYRYLLEEKDSNIIPIEKELEFLKSYIYLLKIRFGENLIIEVPKEELNNFSIAPFTLQLLLENAIKHNVVSSDEPLKIQLFKENGFLVVKNNVQLKSQIGYSSGIGLKNIINRYSLLSSKSILIEETIDAFIVKLPIIADL